MRPAGLTITAERTARGYIAHCRALELSCEGATEDEARRNLVGAITALYGPPAAEVDLRPPPPLRVKQVDVRLHE
ncbi:MAG: hypothetical protein C0506_15235 [Anaerolinea sp.]|nr:hypothetical protein [Anaerolinea sp.]